MRSTSASRWSNLRPSHLPLRSAPLFSRLPSKTAFPGSSAVERSTVNRMVACSNQARGATSSLSDAAQIDREVVDVVEAIVEALHRNALVEAVGEHLVRLDEHAG